MCPAEATTCSDIAVWTTDRRGRVCAEQLLEAEGELDVRAPDRLGGHCAASKSWEYPRGVPEGRGPGPVVVKLDAPPLPRAALKGSVTSSNGQPIKDATIGIESVTLSTGCSYSPGPISAMSSPSGRFALPQVPQGTATLQITHRDFAARTVQAVIPSADADIVLDAGAIWRGHVIDPDGQVLADCLVSARAARSWSATIQCSEGKFSIEHLPPGEVEVLVGTDERSQLGHRTLTTKVHVTDTQPLTQDLSWPKGIAVSGVIVDESGVPIGDARLSALPKGEHRLPSEFHPQEVVARADAAGQFTFRHLAPGPWVITGDLRAPRRSQVEVDGAKDQRGVRLVAVRPQGN